MTRLGVPVYYRGPIRQLGQFSEDQIAAVTEGARSARTVTELREAVAAGAGLPPEDSGPLVGALLGMTQVRRARDESPAEFAVQLSHDPDLELSDAASQSLSQALAQLLDAEGFKSVGRAADVATEHQHIFLNSRVLTDLRPVFPEYVDADASTPDGVVVVHNLKIEYQQDGIHHQFYVAMDEHDLSSLVSTLQRAAKKADALHEMMRAKDVTVYGIGGS